MSIGESEIVMSLAARTGFLRDWKFPAVIAVFEGLTHFGAIQGDSSGYIDFMRFLRGVGSSEILQWHGILRPVVPILALPLSFVVSYGSAIALVNLAYVVLGTVVTYSIGRRFFDWEVGFISAVSFASSVPVLAYGVAVLTDGAGYAMLATVLYVVLFSFPQGKDIGRAVMIGLLFGVAILTKETCFIGLLFLWVHYVLNRKEMALANVLAVTAIALLISFGYSQLAGHSYLGFYSEGLQYGTPGYKGPLIHPRAFLLSIEYAYSILLPFAFMGFFAVGKKQFGKLMEVMFSSGALVLAWPTPPESRLTFLMFPALIPMAAFAVSQASSILAERPLLGRISKRYWLVLVLLIIIAFDNFYARRAIMLPNWG